MMTTIEMMNDAAKTNKTYIIDSMRYSVRRGFHDGNGEPWDANAFDNLNEVLSLNRWKMLDVDPIPKEMTLKEIEQELGHKVKLVSE